ncbi:MAG: TIGR04282 family arsenosugar biosynthesis glycosyltransferase [Thermoplasmatota archaeon]
MKEACILLMVRSPEQGKVKSRLAKSIGDVCALELYKCFVQDVLTTLEGISADLKIGFYPPSGEECVRDWLGEGIDLVPQHGEDLGGKQAGLLERAYKMGYGYALVMISDAPDIPRSLVEDAVEALRSADSVIGPCHDGGYYLIGFSSGSYSREFFRGIPWGGNEAATRMAERIEGSGLTLTLLQPWWDIDDLADLEYMYRRTLKNGYPVRTVSCIRREDILHEAGNKDLGDNTGAQ